MDYPILKQVYGETVRPTVRSIHYHNHLVSRCYRSYNHDIFSYIDVPRDMNSAPMLTLINNTHGCLALARLATLLHLPDTITHPVYDPLLNWDNKDYSELSENTKMMHEIEIILCLQIALLQKENMQ
jgi:hypothetical protein